MSIASEIKAITAELTAKPKDKIVFQRDEEGYATVTFKVRGDGLYSLLKLLKQCEYNGSVGHSHSIVIDPDGGEDKRSVGFDGDGSDRVKEIMVNGELLSEKFEW